MLDSFQHAISLIVNACYRCGQSDKVGHLYNCIRLAFRLMPTVLMMLWIILFTMLYPISQ